MGFINVAVLNLGVGESAMRGRRVSRGLMALVVLAASLGFSGKACGFSVFLEWDANLPQPGGYRVYYGNEPKQLTKEKQVNPSFECDSDSCFTTIEDLPGGHWFFAVTAYNASGESKFSNQVYIPMPPLSLSPDEGTIGTEILLSGPVWEGKKPKVFVQAGQPEGSTWKKVLKVTDWGGDFIQCRFKKKMPAGTHDLMLRIKFKGMKAYSMKIGSFTIMGPEFTGIDKTQGAPGEMITVTGRFFGDKKAKPRLFFDYEDANGRMRVKKCRRAVNGLFWNASTGESALTFLVPNMEPALGVLRLKNKVGEITLPGTFEVQ